LVRFASAAEIAAGGRTTTQTVNGGTYWAIQPSGVTTSLYAIHAHSDAQSLWVTGAAGVVLASTDGGATWVRQASCDGSTSYKDVWFDSDVEAGFIVGRNKICYTFTRGATWSTMYFFGGSTLEAIDGWGTSLPWVVGQYGAILKYQVRPPFSFQAGGAHTHTCAAAAFAAASACAASSPAFNASRDSGFRFRQDPQSPPPSPPPPLPPPPSPPPLPPVPSPPPGAQVGDAESSLGDAKSSLGDAKSSLGDAKSSLGDAKR
jgi:hypothetical protein